MKKTGQLEALIIGFIFGVLLVGTPAAFEWNKDMAASREEGRIEGYIEGVQDCVKFIEPITPPVEVETEKEIYAIGQSGFVFIGGALTDEECIALNSALECHLDSIYNNLLIEEYYESE